MSGSDPARETIGTDEQAEPVGTGEIFETSAEFDWDHPENDPSHPRYEPPHLRHRPGDTWQIGGKPFDIEDRGPYGNPLWRPDRRTGRHRRGELPDPLPPESEAGPEPEPGPTPSPSPVADPRTSPPTVASPRPSPGPRRRGFWTEPGLDHHQGHHQDDRTDPRSGDGYRFDRLREDAWDHFMTDSAPLAAAHRTQSVRRSRQSALDREAGLALAMWIRLARWLFALIRSLSTGPEPKPGPHQNQVVRKPPSTSARQRTGQRPTTVAAAAPIASSGTAAFPQPGASCDPVTDDPTGPVVPVVPQRGSGSCGPNRAEPVSPAARLVAQGGPARATAMARAIAGAQRARTGVAAWA